VAGPDSPSAFTEGDALVWALVGGGVVILLQLAHILRKYLSAPEEERQLPQTGTSLATALLFIIYLGLAALAANLLEAHSKLGAFYDGASGPMLLTWILREGLEFFALPTGTTMTKAPVSSSPPS